jgi:fibronectin-binding autotransporter adhesin
MKTRISNPYLAWLIYPVVLASAALPTTAETLYWNGVNDGATSWENILNWSQDSGATSPNPAANEWPKSDDDVFFNITSANATNQTIHLNAAAQAPKSLTFNSTGTTDINNEAVPSATATNLSLGSGGLTLSSGAGAVRIGGTNAASNGATLVLTDSVTITHNGASSLSTGKAVTTADSLGAKTLTLAGAGITEYGGGIVQGTGTNLSLVIDGGSHYFRTDSIVTGLTLNGGTLYNRGSNQFGLGVDAIPITLNGGAWASAQSSRGFGNPLTIGGNIQLGAGAIPTIGNIVGVGAAGSTFSGTVDLTGGNRTITTIGGNILSGVISNGSLTVGAGSTGTLTISGINSHANTTVSGGTLIVTKAAALPGFDTASRVSVASGTTLRVVAGGVGEWSAAEIDSLLGATTAAFSSGSTLGIEVATGNTFSYANDIGATQAAKGFVKSGAGTLSLDGSNTYTGATTLSAGTLNVNTTTALGTAASTINLNGGTIDNTSGSAKTLANNQAIILGGNFAYSTDTGTATNNLHLGNGAVSIGGNRVITLNGTGTLTFGGLLTNTGNSVRTLTVNNGTGTSPASVVNFGGYALTGSGSTAARVNVIDGSGNVNITGAVTDGISPLSGVTFSGTGVLTLSSANTYTGQTTITAGTVKLGNAAALGNASPQSYSITTTINIATATVPANTPIVVGMQVTGAGIRAGTRVTAYTAATGAVTLNMTAAATGTVSADFVTTTALSAGGVGILDLSGQTIGEVFSNNDGVFINSNTVTPAAITTEMVQMSFPKFDGPGNITVNNIRQGTSTNARRTTKSGAGTLTLGGTLGNNRYGLTVDAGTVLLDKPDGVEAVGRHSLIMNGGTVRLLASNQIHNNTDVGATPAASNSLHQINAGTFDLNGFSEGLGGMGTSTGVEAGGTISNSTGTLSTLTLLGLTNVDPLLTTATFPGPISGNIALVKQGANTQILTGALSYTGSTTVSAGTLSISSASLADASAVTIATGAVLNLNYTDTDTVGSLSVGGGAPLANGSYDALSPETAGFITGNGKLFVNAVSSPYDNWVALYQPGFTINLPAEDQDGDGLTNRQEFAFGLNPTSGSSVNPITTGVAPATGNFSYTRNANSGLTYKVWSSPDLATWTERTGAVQTPVGTPDSFGTQTVDVTNLGATPVGGKLFVRVTAE